MWKNKFDFNIRYAIPFILAAVLILPKISFASTVVAEQLDGGTAFSNAIGSNNIIADVSGMFLATGTYPGAYGQVVISFANASSVTSDCVHISNRTTFADDFGQHCFSLAEFASSSNPSYGQPTIMTFTWGGNGHVRNLTDTWAFLWNNDSTSTIIYGNSTSTAPAFLICDNSGCATPPVPPPTPSTLQFIIPTNGTTTPPFDNFALRLTMGADMTSTDPCQINLSWSIPQVTGAFSTQQTRTCGYYAQNGISFPKGASGANFQNNTITSTLEVAQAYVFNLNHSAFTALASDQVIWTQLLTPSENFTCFLGFCGSVNTTTTLNHIIVQGNGGGGVEIVITPTQNTNNNSSTPQTGTWSWTCPAPGGFTDLGGGIAYGFCVAIRFLLSPTPSIQTAFQNNLQQFQSVFPFSTYFIISNSVNNAASSTGTSSNGGWVLPVEGVNVTVLSSSTIASVFGSSTVNAYFTVSRAILWMGTGLLIIFH